MSAKKFSAEERAAYWKAQAQATPKRRVASQPRRVAVRAPVRVAPARARLTTKVATKQLAKRPAAPQKTIGQQLGGAIVGGASKSIGGMIGHGIQTLLMKLTGFGDYTVHENTLFSGGMSPMQVKNTSYDGGVIMRHREYLAPVLATVNFTNTVYPLNPGLSGTFPWVSAPANAFEQWRLRGCVVEFISTSSDAVLSTNTSSALGQVMIATQYDSINPPFTNKVEMLNHEFSNSRKPSVDFIHPIECKNSLTPQQLFYVRNSAVPTDADERLYDLGLLQVATQGMQAVGGSVGDIYITYEIEFYKPCVIPGAPIGGILTDHWRSVGAGPVGATPLLNFVKQPSSSLNGTISGASSNTYNFPLNVESGKYLVEVYWRGSSTVTALYPVPTTTNCAGLAYFENDTVTQIISPANGVITAVMCQSFVVNITGSGAIIVFGTAGSLPGAVLFGELWITQVDDDLLTKKRRKRKGRGKHHKKMLYMPGDQFPEEEEEEEPEFETPQVEDLEESDSEEYVKVRKTDIKRKSLNVVKESY